MQFTTQVKLKNNDGVFLYRGRWHDGRPFFAYISSTLQQAKKMHGDFERKVKVASLDVYGKVIYKDWQSEPDTRALTFLKNWLKNNNGEAAA